DGFRNMICGVVRLVRGSEKRWELCVREDFEASFRVQVIIFPGCVRSQGSIFVTELESLTANFDHMNRLLLSLLRSPTSPRVCWFRRAMLVSGISSFNFHDLEWSVLVIRPLIRCQANSNIGFHVIPDIWHPHCIRDSVQPRS